MRPIAKLAGSLLALGALVGCSGSGTLNGGLYVTNPVLTSGYVDNKGNPLICYNINTPMEFDFLYGGNLQSIVVSLNGVTTGAQQGITPTGTNFTGGQGAVTFTVPAGTAPLSLPGSAGARSVRPQSIVVTPNVIGYSELQMQAFGAGGVTDVLTSNAVPVINNCF